ncbi:MAG: hypothetical protein OQK55_00810, partial [Thermoanaerobaculales bacterium]|nr:hypothetical protein [Thermoanaerobaculales bacterium]
MFRSGWRSGTVLFAVLVCVTALTAAAGEKGAKQGDRERLLFATRDIVAAARFCALVTTGADG